MRKKRLTTSLLLCCAASVSCANRPVRLATPCALAEPQLRAAWQELNEALQTPGGCEAEHGLRCETIRARIERLSIDCPNQPDLVMANALLAFEARNFARAQQLLDELSGLQVSYPEAAVLRARIALEQGNLLFALRYLDQQIRQTGDDPALREVYASALYLTGRWDEAREQLLTAQRLGAPAWRVDFGRGLIEEARGMYEAARQLYETALRSRPGWKVAESRIRALVASGKVPSEAK